jgi:hypothetical protein
MKNLPTIIAARDGSRALKIEELSRVGQVRNRDAVGYRFHVSNTPHGEILPLTVIFSGTVYSLKAEVFDLPEIEEREARFTQFALAAIGDALDTGPIEDTEGEQVAQLECFSPRFQSWRDREKAAPSVIRRYMQAHTYWAWEHGADSTTLGMPDALRLGVPFELIRREAELYDGEDWLLGRGGSDDA